MSLVSLKSLTIRASVGAKNRWRVLPIKTVGCENSLSSILLITLRHHLPLSERLFLALWYKPHHKVQFYLKAIFTNTFESLLPRDGDRLKSILRLVLYSSHLPVAMVDAFHINNNTQGRLQAQTLNSAASTDCSYQSQASMTEDWPMGGQHLAPDNGVCSIGNQNKRLQT